MVTSSIRLGNPLRIRLKGRGHSLMNCLWGKADQQLKRHQHTLPSTDHGGMTWWWWEEQERFWMPSAWARTALGTCGNRRKGVVGGGIRVSPAPQWSVSAPDGGNVVACWSIVAIGLLTPDCSPWNSFVNKTSLLGVLNAMPQTYFFSLHTR